MGDYIHVEQGRLPWEPSEGTERTRVVHEWDIPLIGTVRQNGNGYVFWCVVGHAAPTNVWAYALVDDEAAAAKALEDADDLPMALRSLVEGRVSTFALAGDEAGIREFAVLEPPASFEDVYPRGMLALSEKINEVVAEYQDFQRRMGSLDDVAAFRLAPTGVPGPDS